MTQQFETLLRDFGYLAAMIHNLDDARELWASVPRQEEVTVPQFGLPESFLRAYADGTTKLRLETPEFLYGMAFTRMASSKVTSRTVCAR